MNNNEIEKLKFLILNDIDDIIMMLEDKKNKIENCNNEKTLKEYDEQIHINIYNEVDLLDYIEK